MPPKMPKMLRHEQHVVNVGDDEVGVVDVDVHRRGRHEDAADRPPMTNMDTNARASSIGVVNWMFAVPDGAEPVEDLHGADGRAIMMVASMKPVPSRGSMPLWNM